MLVRFLNEDGWPSTVSGIKFSCFVLLMQGQAIWFSLAEALYSAV